MEWWQVYLFVKLDDFVIVFSIICGLFGTALFVVAMLNYMEDGELGTRCKKTIALPACGFVFFGTLCLLTPSTKQFAAIYLLPKIANSDAMKEAETIPHDAIELLKSKLQTHLREETKQEKK